MGATHTFKRFKSIAPETELDRIFYQMAYGDDSKETWKRYCELMGVIGTEEELEQKRKETFSKE